MPNPTGTNGGLFIPETPYGDVKRQTELMRSAPISGAETSTSAIETPRRSGKQAQRGRQTPSEQGAPPVLPVAAPPPSYQLQVAQAWRDVANTPGADQFPILAQLAQAADQEAQRGPTVPVP